MFIVITSFKRNLTLKPHDSKMVEANGQESHTFSIGRKKVLYFLIINWSQNFIGRITDENYFADKKIIVPLQVFEIKNIDILLNKRNYHCIAVT